MTTLKEIRDQLAEAKKKLAEARKVTKAQRAAVLELRDQLRKARTTVRTEKTMAKSEQAKVRAEKIAARIESIERQLSELRSAAPAEPAPSASTEKPARRGRQKKEPNVNPERSAAAPVENNSKTKVVTRRPVEKSKERQVERRTAKA